MIKTKENSSLRQFYSGKNAAVLRVTGEDAANFLQGQFTNDLRGLTTGGAVYGLWLNQKGKVLADSFVIAGASAGEFWIVSYHVAAALWQGERQVGELRSAVNLAEGGFIGLAMVSLVSWQPAQPLALEVAGAAEILVVPEVT